MMNVTKNRYAVIEIVLSALYRKSATVAPPIDE